MTTITSPLGADVKGLPAPGGLLFDEAGSFTTDDEAVLNYCRGAGYIVDGTPPLPFGEPPVDARDAALAVTVGTPLRDAAVDPRASDYLPPINAGLADPHGPLVVAPGIHAIETQVVRPGVVGVDDVPAQEAAETAQATALLIDGQDVGEAVPQFVHDVSQTGELEMSDPGSVTPDVGAPDVHASDAIGVYDPAEHTVDQIKAHLATVDEPEQQRILDAERAGKARATLVG